MQYFKHISNMRHDRKIKKLIIKYGVEGYGWYNLILESITENLTNESPMPELEETCDELASFYNGNTAKINEIVCWMINESLLELNEITERVMCTKLYKYLESSQTRSEKLRDMIKNYKNTSKTLITVASEMSETVTDICERKEENRIEKNIYIDEIYNHYPNKCLINNRSTGKSSKDKTKISKLLKSGLNKNDIIELIDLYIADCKKSNTYIKNFGTFLNNLPDKESFNKPHIEEKPIIYKEHNFEPKF